MSPERFGRRAALVAALLPLAIAGPASPAQAAPALDVSATTNLEDGQVLTVSGSGYDEDKGIYVALCAEPAPGDPPGPCLGGVDTSGAAGSSAWVSSNPPPYGAELAQPYEPGGSFTVELTVRASDDFVDCRTTTCGIATRADHTRSSDRSQDVFVPVTFVGGAPAPTPTSSPTPTPADAPPPAASTPPAPAASPSPAPTPTPDPTPTSPTPSATPTPTASPDPTPADASPSPSTPTDALTADAAAAANAGEPPRWPWALLAALVVAVVVGATTVVYGRSRDRS